MTLKRQLSAAQSTAGFYKDKNLYTAMDKLLEWQDTPDHQSVLKHRTSSWPLLPPVLVFNLMRAKKDYKVDHSKFSFDETVFMDPYTTQHREQWLTDQHLKSLRNSLADDLDNMATQQQSLEALHVGDVVAALRAEALLAAGETAKSIDAAADTLMFVHERQQFRLRNTRAEVLSNRQKIAEYFNSRSQYRYRLQAVVVHRGASANSGHYYCYVRHGTGWVKCDDDTVQTGLSAADVLQDSAGSNNASASFLIYVDDHAVQLKMAEAKLTPGEIDVDKRLMERINTENRKILASHEPIVKDLPTKAEEPAKSTPTPPTAEETDHLQTLEVLGCPLQLQSYRELMAEFDNDFQMLVDDLLNG